ncbi:glycoside hydrolase family 3 N-terminal domain-containing protein [Marinicellulosiphila megalodicopiae]|uniref:glycoside hydrolase family 3 N-terminal domain-containing protein n=1 Tax=Marinicellulosiphila megalodicopiae TaxID=2724896 RepID=UPI003BB0516C
MTIQIMIKKSLIGIWVLLLCLAFWMAFVLPKNEQKTIYTFEDFYAKTDPNYLSQWPKNIYPQNNPTTEAFIQTILKQLTLEEKIAQMILLPDSISSDEFNLYPYSGLVFDQGRKDTGGKRIRDWHKGLDKWWNSQKETAEINQRPFIPPFLKLNLQAGNGFTLAQAIFPPRLNLGQTRNPQLVEQVASLQAKQATQTGFNWLVEGFDSPIHDKRIAQISQSFSEDPALNKKLASAYVQAVQPKNHTYNDIMTSSRGYLALGSASFLRGNIFEDESVILNRYAQGHIGAIEQGVLSVELSNGQINSKNMLNHRYYVQTILKQTMGFTGIVTTSLNATAQNSGCRLANCASAINAGVDMFYFDSDVAISAGPSSFGSTKYHASEKFIQNTASAVKNGSIKQSRIDDAVLRILRVKHKLGLFNYQSPSERAESIKIDDTELLDLVNKTVIESSVLIKNQANTLPLNNKYKVLLTGLGADELTHQIGVWANGSLRNLNNRSIKQGSTLVESFESSDKLFDHVPFEFIDSQGITQKALEQFNKREDGKMIPKKDKLGIYGELIELDSDDEQDIIDYQKDYEKRINKALRYYQQIVFVISQDPVLDGTSTESTLDFSEFYRNQLNAFKLLEKLDSKITVIIFGHSPMYMPEIMDSANAIIFAGRPGTHSAGLISVLYGEHDSKLGQLGFSWPRLPCDFKHSVGVLDYDPFLKFGFGLDNLQQIASWRTAVPEEIEYCSPIKR